MKVVFASKNQGKIREVKQAFQGTDIELLCDNEVSFSDVEETGTTFLENALIKARNACKQTGLAALADDSGIEVAHLKGAPGVYSARYSGPNASSDSNLEKLIDELKGVPLEKREATYRCVFVFVRFFEDPFPLVAMGSWKGVICQERQGEKGFGYDPIFYLLELKKTAAELSLEHKNSISHRAIALHQLKQQLLTS